ncbi:MAG: hypothetical protein EOP05_11460 [Proteobacteria bacterium]|nr:MAG: hypothetical protein EOP05_11460 [Pseudomonadota bacterium]
MSLFNARLASSTKWTEVPEDFLAKVRTVFNNQFKAEAVEGEFIADGHIYPQEIILRVGYLEKGRLKQINFEASMDLKLAEAKAKSAPSMQGPATISDMPSFLGAAESNFDDEGGVFADSQAETATSTVDRLYVCIDALGSLMEEYFKTGSVDEMDVPLHWKMYEFEEEEVFLQYSTVNTRLEEEANRLLGLLGDDLFNDGGTNEDALAVAEIDSELAADVQKAIRNGTYKPFGSDHDHDQEDA